LQRKLATGTISLGEKERFISQRAEEVVTLQAEKKIDTL
jgi:hypothetical protein